MARLLPVKQELILHNKSLSSLDMQVNRLLYRSKQRGFLEMDLLLGLWAKEHVPKASEPLLAAFEVYNPLLDIYAHSDVDVKLSCASDLRI